MQRLIGILYSKYLVVGFFREINYRKVISLVKRYFHEIFAKEL